MEVSISIGSVPKKKEASGIWFISHRKQREGTFILKVVQGVPTELNHKLKNFILQSIRLYI